MNSQTTLGEKMGKHERKNNSPERKKRKSKDPPLNVKVKPEEKGKISTEIIGSPTTTPMLAPEVRFGCKNFHLKFPLIINTSSFMFTEY